jgi:Alpha/beta-hydrolase family N-terminus
MGVTDYNIPLVIASPFVAALVFCLLLLIGRGLRGLYRWAANLLNRWIGRRAARGVGWVLVVGLTYLVVSGLLLQGFVNLMNSAYSLRDTMTAEGVHQPTTSLRSGGPGSVIPWDTLGWQGRNFIGKGPSVSDIEKFTGQPAMEPIRACKAPGRIGRCLRHLSPFLMPARADRSWARSATRGSMISPGWRSRPGWRHDQDRGLPGATGPASRGWPPGWP